MLNRRLPTSSRALSRSWQVLPYATSSRISISSLNTSCLRAPRKHNASRHPSASSAFARSYATAAEAARSTGEYSPTVNLDLTSGDGGITTVEIRPSYPHKPKAVENLLASLPGLLTDAGMPASAIDTFANKGWDLDESGDTIHRYVGVQSERDMSSILDHIKAVSSELKHDPHIHIDGNQLTISCTTHVPPGLSMKDVKLARKVNDILTEAGITGVTHTDKAEILTQRQRGREHNMEAIRKAKLDCGCG